MGVCAYCGEPLRVNARFCRHCGKEIPDQDSRTLCQQCGRVVKAGALFCSACGARVVRAAEQSGPLCSHCGAPVRAAARFCRICRAPLPAASITETTSTCPNCGMPTRTASRFCRHCSHPLHIGPAPPLPSAMPGSFGTGNLPPLTVLVGRYLILEKIAQGGMGAIYKVRDQRLEGKIMAAKEMSETAIRPSERERVLESFRREAELLARLEHPNLVRVTDRFEDGKRHYMVMEFIEGQTLLKMLEARTEPFPEKQVLSWAEQLCDVLAYLHSQTPKIIYRDVKPANVMVLTGSDEVKLIDFGIARFYKPGQRRDTIEFGTDGYAPPEQYGKQQTDERSDVYALGAMLHQLLTLRDPLTTPFSFPPLRSLNSAISRRVEAAIARALEPVKQDRHASMAEMRATLLGGSVRPPSKPSRPAPAKPQQVPSTSEDIVPVPAALDFGPLGRGLEQRSFTLAIPAGEEAALRSSTPWLRVEPVSVKGGGKVQVTANGTRVKPGKLDVTGSLFKRWVGWHARLFVPAARPVQGVVEISLKDGQQGCVSVSAAAVPRPGRVVLGWAMAVIAMSLEVGLLAALAGALVLGLSYFL